ncbi:MAG: hypothetical protein WAK82_43870 [Streptosporangiaceae bacterium]
MVRRDRVRQAVSWLRAAQEGVWLVAPDRYPDVLGGVLEFLEVDAAQMAPPAPRTWRQADGLNDEWAERFERERAARRAGSCLAAGGRIHWRLPRGPVTPTQLVSSHESLRVVVRDLVLTGQPVD